MSFDDPGAESSTKHTDSLEYTATLTSLLVEGAIELPDRGDLDLEAKAAIKVRY